MIIDLMPILISSLFIVIFYYMYKFLLEQESGFVWIRFYLIIVILLCLIAPFFDFGIPARLHLQSMGTAVNLPVTNRYRDYVDQIRGGISKQALDIFRWISVAYATVCLIITATSIAKILPLWFCIRSAETISQSGYVLVFNRNFSTPFSFFKWVFVPKEDLSDQELKSIITHEAAHVRQLHSVDMLLAQLMIIIFWFNPIAWKLRQAVKLNHEFLADQEVLGSGIVTKAGYQTVLLNQLSEGKLIPYVSHFNHSELKRRLMMMSASKINQTRLIFKIIILLAVSSCSITTAFVLIRPKLLFLRSALNGIDDSTMMLQMKQSVKPLSLEYPHETPVVQKTPAVVPITLIQALKVKAKDKVLTQNIEGLNQKQAITDLDTVRDKQDPSSLVVISYIRRKN